MYVCPDVCRCEGDQGQTPDGAYWMREHAPVKATARFTSLLGHAFDAGCVFTGFSPVS